MLFDVKEKIMFAYRNEMQILTQEVTTIFREI